MKKKFCIFTGTRAEYGLLKPLIDELLLEPEIEVQMLISGMHLSPEFGLTINDIELQGIKKVEKIEMLLSSDSSVGITKAMGLGMISFADAFERLKPDLLIGLGDRFELFSAVSAAMIARIPVAHIHGGELTFGAYDDALRHAITKMSHLHFTSNAEYRKRIVQLGENPNTVFNVGALGIDNVRKINLLTLRQLEESISFDLSIPFFVITFHPVTLEYNSSEKQFLELLYALDNFKEFKFIFTKPNADNNGRIIIKLIDDYIKRNESRCIAFESLGQLRYLSTLKFAKMMIGNSSSGIIEMPCFNKPTINIGDRQVGRVFPDSVIQCNPYRKSIITAINKGLKKDFQKVSRLKRNTYGDGRAAIKIKKILMKKDFPILVKKNFFDIKF